MLRGIEPGPINTFLHWHELGRIVRKGERAITLCMPVTRSRKVDTAKLDPLRVRVGDDVERLLTGPGGVVPGDGTIISRTIFVYKPRWFVLSQTEGEPYTPQELPNWSEERALTKLSITRIPFTHLDGNVQGFARERLVSVSPIAFAPHRTLFHELAHVVLGHTAQVEMTDDERTPRDLGEVEAEGVALICCESLGLGGAEYSRGYLQHWLRSDSIPDRSAQRIFKAADTILRAARPEEKGAVP
jgi:hypothetical protein